MFSRHISGAVAAAFLDRRPGPARGRPGASRAAWPQGSAVVSYTSERALERALARHPAAVVRRLPSLRVVEVRPRGDVGATRARLAAEPGIVARRARSAAALVRRARARRRAAAGVPLQWQYAAVHADQIAPEIAQAADKLTIAVIDTGADLGAPDLAAKSPVHHSVRARSSRVSGDVTDLNGHGTFVAALAAGSGSNGEGVAGIAGEAQLMIVQAGGPTGAFTDVEEAAAIVYAVDHGARILNLSLGGPSTSTTERRAIDYAVSKGALARRRGRQQLREREPDRVPGRAAPARRLARSRWARPRGCRLDAQRERGLSFSSTGTHRLARRPRRGRLQCPFGRLSGLPVPARRASRLRRGLYGYGSGTSFATPQVAGAAALVWAANPQLRADEVATILEQTASGLGAWNAELGYGVLDVAAAVGSGAGPGVCTAAPADGNARRDARRRWSGRRSRAPRASGSRVARDSEPERVLTAGATSYERVVLARRRAAATRFTVAAARRHGRATRRLGAVDRLAAAGARAAQPDGDVASRRRLTPGRARRPAHGPAAARRRGHAHGACSSRSTARVGPVLRPPSPTRAAAPSGATRSRPARTGSARATRARTRSRRPISAPVTLTLR